MRLGVQCSEIRKGCLDGKCVIIIVLVFVFLIVQVVFSSALFIAAGEEKGSDQSDAEGKGGE